MSRWWQPCDEYLANARAMTRADGWWGILLFVLQWPVMMTIGWYYLSEQRVPHDQLLVSAVDLLVIVLFIALALRVRGQSWASVGFSRTRLRASSIAGAVIVVVGFAGARLVAELLGQAPPPQWSWLTIGVPYYLIGIGFTEELAFRGFITPRLIGALGSVWKGVVAGGLMFSFMHIPFQLVMLRWDWAAIGQQLVWMLPITFAWHGVLWWLSAKWNSLAAPTGLHFWMNGASVVM